MKGLGETRLPLHKPKAAERNCGSLKPFRWRGRLQFNFGVPPPGLRGSGL